MNLYWRLQARADLAREDAERFAEERAAANASDVSLAEQQRLKQLLEEVGQNIEDIKLELGKERETHGNEKLRVQQEHEQRVQDLRSKHEDERTLLRSKTDQIRDEHSRMAEEMRQQLDNERHAHTRTKDDDKGRLLEHSRTAGVLEGKIIANTEENKGLRQRLQALEEKAHETELAIRQYMEEEKTLRPRGDGSKGAGCDRGVCRAGKGDTGARGSAGSRQRPHQQPPFKVSVPFVTGIQGGLLQPSESPRPRSRSAKVRMQLAMSSRRLWRNAVRLLSSPHPFVHAENAAYQRPPQELNGGAVDLESADFNFLAVSSWIQI
eukprot:s691_g6.t2